MNIFQEKIYAIFSVLRTLHISFNFTSTATLWRTMFSPFCTEGYLGEERFANLPRMVQPISDAGNSQKSESVKKLYFFSQYSAPMGTLSA